MNGALNEMLNQGVGMFKMNAGIALKFQAIIVEATFLLCFVLFICCSDFGFVLRFFICIFYDLILKLL